MVRASDAMGKVGLWSGRVGAIALIGGAAATVVAPEGPGEIALAAGAGIDAGAAMVATEANVASVVMYGVGTGKWDKAAILGIQNTLNFWGPLRNMDMVNSMVGHGTDELLDKATGRSNDCN